MSLHDDYDDCFEAVEKMTGTELRQYWFRHINDERIFETRAVSKFCYGGGCSEFQCGGDDLVHCRAGDDGLTSPSCERYWEVSDLLRAMICADLIVRRALGDEHD